MPFDEPQQIETVENLSALDFKKNYRAKEIPVKIIGAIDGCQALSEWSFDFFRREYGNEIVGVEKFEPHERGPGNNSPQNYCKYLQYIDLKLADLIDIIQTKPDHMYYMAQHPFRKCFRGLRGSLPRIPYLADCISYIPGAHMDTYLWIGPKGTLTPIHIDPMPNFLTQIVGRKKITVFPKAQVKDNLYIGQFERESFSPVDIEQPNLDLYPNYAACTPYESIIHPGETVFIPRNWGHSLTAMDNSISLTSFFITYLQLITLFPEFVKDLALRSLSGWKSPEQKNERATRNPPPIKK